MKRWLAYTYCAKIAYREERQHETLGVYFDSWVDAHDAMLARARRNFADTEKAVLAAGRHYNRVLDLREPKP